MLVAAAAFTCVQCVKNAPPQKIYCCHFVWLLMRDLLAIAKFLAVTVVWYKSYVRPLAVCRLDAMYRLVDRECGHISYR